MEFGDGGCDAVDGEALADYAGAHYEGFWEGVLGGSEELICCSGHELGVFLA